MSDQSPLNYPRPNAVSGEAIAAFIIGLFSGPVGLALAWAAISYLTSDGRLIVAFLALVVTHVFALVVAILAVRRVDRDRLRGGWLAATGAIATLVWAMVISIYLADVISHLE